jgi:hypothetical protein
MGYAVGPRWLLRVGILVVGVAGVSLAVIVHQSLPERRMEPPTGEEAWVYWIFFATIILLGLIGLLFRFGILY